LLTALLYQLSTLRVCRTLLDDDSARKDKEFVELRALIKHGIVARMFNYAMNPLWRCDWPCLALLVELEKSPLMFVELLFTKTLQDVEEIQYGHFEAMKRRGNKTRAWSVEGTPCEP
jgi:hypothetical protein